MVAFSFLKPYIFDEDDARAAESKHSFYKLSDEEIENARDRLGFSFPTELHAFYREIGYGFMWNQEEKTMDRFMDPMSVADFYLCEGMYQSEELFDHYDEDYLVFFEVNEVSYIALRRLGKNEEGKCPVYYLDTQIANSLEEFLKKLHAIPDYYLDEKK
jgi:antitoxin YxxD